MSCYFNKTLTVGFDEAVRRTTEALQREVARCERRAFACRNVR
jgi:hypothetical protein